jgi:hypothetical protein
LLIGIEAFIPRRASIAAGHSLVVAGRDRLVFRVFGGGAPRDSAARCTSMSV